MKLYDSLGPNPQIVRTFMAEKGITLPTQTIDLPGGENRREPYISEVNPAGTTPALQLDDGRVVAEVTAICEYLEERFPEPPLIGATPEDRAITRMWVRRVDLYILEPMAHGFRSGEGRNMFKDRIKLYSETAAPEFKAMARDRLLWLDRLMGDNRFVCGDRFTLADIMLYCFPNFVAGLGQPIPEEARWLPGWFERMRARPSVNS